MADSKLRFSPKVSITVVGLVVLTTAVVWKLSLTRDTAERVGVAVGGPSRTAEIPDGSPGPDNRGLGGLPPSPVMPPTANQMPPMREAPVQSQVPPDPNPNLPSSTLPPGVLERFPSIEAPAVVPPESETSIEVSLALDPRSPEVKIAQSGPGTALSPQGGLLMKLPCDPSCAIEVVLQAPAFNITSGSNTATVQMPSNGDSTPARFKIKALGNAPPGNLSWARHSGTMAPF